MDVKRQYSYWCCDIEVDIKLKTKNMVVWVEGQDNEIFEWKWNAFWLQNVCSWEYVWVRDRWEYETFYWNTNKTISLFYQNYATCY